MANIFEYIKACEKQDDKFYTARNNWLYNMLVVSAGLLGAVIALTDNTESPYYARLLFLLSVALGLLGVLLGAIGLHFDVAYQKEKRAKMREQISNSPDKSNIEDLISVTPPLIYWRISQVSCILLAASLLLLFCYVAFKNLPEWFI